MSIFDIENMLGGTAGTRRRTTRSSASSSSMSTGSLLGIGGLAALMGAVMPGGVMKKAAMMGAGAVAYNFYKKWSQEKAAQEQAAQQGQYGQYGRQPQPQYGQQAPNQYGQYGQQSQYGQPRQDQAADGWQKLLGQYGQQPQEPKNWRQLQEQYARQGQQPGAPASARPAGNFHQFGDLADSDEDIVNAERDPTAILLLRAMLYSARADGHIDDTEKDRIIKLAEQFLPGKDVTRLVSALMTEPLDVNVIASSVTCADQREDVYRLSCLVIDIDHFMERGYLDALAKAMDIKAKRQKELEKEAASVMKQLDASS